MIITLFNDLKIKHKLILLVALPLLLLFLLAATNTRNEWHKLQLAKDHQEHQNQVSMFVSLVHELQLERGISAGYLASKATTFQKPLQKQRLQTDSKLDLLRKNITVENKQYEIYRKLQDKLAQLLKVRSEVDELNPNSDYFQFYSNINSNILEQLQRLNSNVNNKGLVQLNEAYTNLLWLQEIAGQERAAVTSIFASGKFDLESIQQLHNYDSKQKDLLRNFYQVIATPAQQKLLSDHLDHPAVKRTTEIQKSILNKVKKSSLLNELQQLIGYGGLIHDFKNYVLRGSPKYQAHYVEYFKKAKTILQKYRQLPRTSDTEISDLEIIMSTVQNYRNNLSRITTMHKNKINPENIDKTITIDDAPAIAAIKRLQGDAYATKASQWFKDSTQRIDLIKEVGETISVDIKYDVAQLIHHAGGRFVTLASLTILALFTSLVITTFISKQLAGGISAVSGALQRMKNNRHFQEYIAVESTDEIGVMANSFNDLIAERKESEEALEKTHQHLEEAKNIAEKANNAKSDFLARMSHELRTPMNAILGFGQLMKYDNELSPDRKDDVHEILVAGSHLLELINDVLDLARIEADHIKIVNEPISCHEIIEEAISITMPLIEQRNITINFEKGIDDDILLQADPTRLKEVLLNLLSNAVKYNRIGGTITINIEPMPRERQRIIVSDSGKGLSINQQLHLFQPFERLGAENSDIEGTGIGLVISKRIIELMDGSIGVNSLPGQGCSFWFELNIVDPNSIETMSDKALGAEYLRQDEPSITGLKQNGLNILYVEDNPANIKLVERLMRKYSNATLLVAMTGREALEMAATCKPELILLDINLPDIDGFEVLDEIRKLDECHEIPIVAVSANALLLDIERALKAGFSDYITKPISFSRFFAVLNELLPDEEQANNNINAA